MTTPTGTGRTTRPGTGKTTRPGTGKTTRTGTRVTALTGTGRLLRLGIRRDRVALTTWIVALGVLVVASVASIAGLYTTAAEREAAAAFAAANRLARAFDGPATGTSVGALTMMEAFGVLAVLTGLMSIQTMVRHTRQDEETGRADLLGSAVVGHHARLAAATLVTLAANLILGATICLVLLAQDLPVTGSLAAGGALAGVGMTFGAVAAVTAQLVEHQRSASGLASIVLGLAFLLRAVGDAAGEVAASGVELVSAWPSWLSPIGWGQQVRPFGGDHLDVLGLFALTIVVLLATSVALASRRDLGGALVATRPGPTGAAGRLRSPLRLAWRLHRGGLVGWIAGVMVLAGALGGLADGAEELVGLSEDLAVTFEQMAVDGSLVDVYVAFIMGIMGIVAAAFGVQTVTRARSEESSERLEPLLATAVHRVRWLGTYAILAIAGSGAILLAAGLAAGTSYGFATGDLVDGIAAFLAAGAVQWPAAVLIAAITVTTFAFLPRFTAGVGWALVAGSFVMGQLGDLLGLSQAVMNLSPFTHVPLVPAESFRLTPILLLTGLALVAGALGLLGFRRRDVMT